MVLGGLSTRYTMKSSLKDFVVLCLLLFRGASLSSSIGFSTSEGSTCVTGMVGSGEMIGSLLNKLGVSFLLEIRPQKSDISGHQYCALIHVGYTRFHY